MSREVLPTIRILKSHSRRPQPGPEDRGLNPGAGFAIGTSPRRDPTRARQVPRPTPSRWKPSPRAPSTIR